MNRNNQNPVKNRDLNPCSSTEIENASKDGPHEPEIAQEMTEISWDHEVTPEREISLSSTQQTEMNLFKKSFSRFGLT